MSILRLLEVTKVLNEIGQKKFKLINTLNGSAVFMILDSRNNIVSSSHPDNENAERLIFNYCHGHNKESFYS